jgi:hypothetical protein
MSSALVANLVKPLAPVHTPFQENFPWPKAQAFNIAPTLNARWAMMVCQVQAKEQSHVDMEQINSESISATKTSVWRIDKLIYSSVRRSSRVTQISRPRFRSNKLALHNVSNSKQDRILWWSLTAATIPTAMSRAMIRATGRNLSRVRDSSKVATTQESGDLARITWLRLYQF